MEEECEPEEDRLELEVPEVPREDDTRIGKAIRTRLFQTIQLIALNGCLLYLQFLYYTFV